MTSDDLNQLFASAREIPVETAPEQIAGWVGTAAITGSGVIGVAAKLKLFIAKKSIIMLGISLGSAGVIVLSTALIVQSPSDEKKPVDNHAKSTTTVTQENEQPTKKPNSQVVLESTEVEEPQDVANTQDVAEEVEVTTTPTPMHTEFMVPMGVAQNEQLHSLHIRDRSTWVKPTLRSKGGKDTVKGNGQVTKEERAVQPFSEIHISGIFDVILTQGGKEAVTVETDGNLQENVLVENDGNSLILKNSKAKIKKSTKMVVYVTVKDISKIKTTGVGDIKCENTIKASNMDLVLSNVGDADLNIECQKLNVKYNGVGDLRLTGSANESTITSAGVGDLKAFDMQVKTMNITHTGVGDAAINVSEDLTLDFRGVGDVYYKGNPEKKDIKKSGVGSVKKRS